MKTKLFLCLALLPFAAWGNAIKGDATPPDSDRLLKAAAERWSKVEKAESPSFRRHVVPLMSRLGCSGRECHGSFSGQGGFQLSLFGYDFEKDYREITADAEDGIRVELKDPITSLILAKPALDGEKHKGKKIIEKGSWEYNLLLKWIQDGAKYDVAETGEFARLEVLPKELVFQNKGQAIQLKVLAHWKDGTVENVTQITRFRTNDESVAEVSATGLVTSKEKGDTHIVAFYDNGVEPVPAMLPVSTKPIPLAKARTKVDGLILEKLKKVGIVPSEIANDPDFLRRASLDVTGTLPSPQEIEAFLADRSPDKRSRKIDELLSRPAYAGWWTTKLCDFTGNNPRQINNTLNASRNLSSPMARQWYDWIYKRVAENKPYDELAAGIILATGRTSATQTYEEYVNEMGSYFRKDHPVDFTERGNMPYFWQRRNVQKPEEKSLAFAHTFLGVRIECAECHKHPFDQWTKTDFEQFKAFFTALVAAPRNDGKATKDAQGNVQPIGPDQPMTYTTLVKEIRDQVTSSLSGQPIDPKRNTEQRALQTEYTKRLDAGQPVPWPELYVDMKRAAQPTKDGPKNKVQGSSRVITPKILGGEEVMLQQFNDPREPLMAWLRDKENPYFSRAFVNRVWASYFHRGIVEPADDLNLANAPVNAPLLDYLSAGFIAHGYDMKWLHREILNSDTYQRSWKTNETNKLDEKNFSHAVIRRLPAESVADAINMATASATRVATFSTDISDRAIGPIGNGADRGQGGGKNADGYALGIFGKPARMANCDCERTSDPTLLQTIYTRNDPTFLARIDLGSRNAWIEDLRRSVEGSPEKVKLQMQQRIKSGEEKLAAMTPPEKPAAEPADAEAQEMYTRKLKQYEDSIAEIKLHIGQFKQDLAEAEKPRAPFNLEDAIREVFLRTVSRPPTSEELAKAREDVASARSPVEGLRELLWTMLNTREFIVNR